MKNMKFDVLWDDTVVIHIAIVNDTVTVKKYIDDIVKQPFGSDQITTKHVMDFFCSRIFDVARPDKDQILRKLGLKEYDPVQIIKKTHGVMYGDHQWIRFTGENLTWGDVSGNLSN